MRFILNFQKIMGKKANFNLLQIKAMVFMHLINIMIMEYMPDCLYLDQRYHDLPTHNLHHPRIQRLRSRTLWRQTQPRHMRAVHGKGREHARVCAGTKRTS